MRRSIFVIGLEIENALIKGSIIVCHNLPEAAISCPCPQSFRDYIAGVKDVLDRVKSRNFSVRASEQREIVAKVGPLLAQLFRDRDFLPGEYHVPLSHKAYSKYLLYKGEDSSFIVVAMVWRPGVVTPIHDHRTWGVIGVLKGREEETRYDRIDDGSLEGHARIRKAAVLSYGPGEISVCCLPQYDIHSVKNIGETVAISIHTYGGDQSSIESTIYDPENESVRKYVSPCDPLPQKITVEPLLASV